MWGELASHKKSLTHCPSSQGWASRCPLLYMFVWVMVGWVLSYCFSYTSVLSTCISMYIVMSCFMVRTETKGLTKKSS